MGRCPASSRSAPCAMRQRIDLDAVVAPPYDVLSDADVDDLAARDAHNIVHVDVPRGGPDRYDAAGELLRAWLADGVLVRDDAPSFTLYRMRFTDATGARRDLVGVRGRARGRRRGCRRRAAPRAHDAQGVDGPARPDAGDRGQPLAGLGAFPGDRADRVAAPIPASRSAR